MRNRLEDLGRLMILIEGMLENKIFLELENQPFTQTGNDIVIQRDDLYFIMMRLEACYSICKGEDYLNEGDPACAIAYDFLKKKD